MFKINKKVKTLIKILLPIIIGLLLFWLVFKHIDIENFVKTIKNAKAGYIILYFLVSYLITFLGVIRWKLILDSHKHKKINFFYLVKAYLAGYAVSYITPSAKLGGEPVKAALLKRKGLETHKVLSTIIIDKMMEIGGSGLFFIIGVIILSINYALPENLKFLIIVLCLMFIGLIGLAIYYITQEKGFILSIYKFFRLHKMKKWTNVTKKIIQTEKMIVSFYKKDKKQFIYALFVMAIAWALMFVEYKLAMLIFGFNGNLLQIFLAFSVVGAAYIIPVPFAIGTLEGGQVALFNAIKLNSAIGLSVGLLTRVKDSILAGIGLMIAAYYGVAKKENLTNSAKFNKEIFGKNL